MVKKILAGAIASVVLATSAMMVSGTVFAATSGKINGSKYQNKYYHTCKVDGCEHYYMSKYLDLYANGSWGFVTSRDSGHRDSYKYISVTTYTINSDDDYIHSVTLNNAGCIQNVVSPNLSIHSAIAKVVYNGQIFRTSEKTSGLLKKYLIGSFRSGCPVK